jgi:hypothetical protein
MYIYLPVTRPVCSTAPVSNQQNIVPSSNKTATTVENKYKQLRYGMNVATQTGPRRRHVARAIRLTLAVDCRQSVYLALTAGPCARLAHPYWLYGLPTTPLLVKLVTSTQ